jgi:hypothetical protein
MRVRVLFLTPGRGGGAWCFSRSGASTTPNRRPRDDVAVSQPEARGGYRSATASSLLHLLRAPMRVHSQQQLLHLLRAPMRIHSHRRVRAPAAAQPRQNEQALPVERLCMFYPSGDMSGSVPVYVIQGFHTVNRTCLSCSPVSIVSRNRSGAAKPR